MLSESWEMLDALADTANMLNYHHILNTQAVVLGHSHSNHSK